jgi:hypothetical protein
MSPPNPQRILPVLIGRADTRAHRFDASCVNMVKGRPYWRDVGTLDAYWEANIDLTTVTPELNFCAGLDLEKDCTRFEVSDHGTILITPEMLGQHMHSLR